MLRNPLSTYRRGQTLRVPDEQSAYEQLIGKTRVDPLPARSTESELDSLLSTMRERGEANGGRIASDPMKRLRELTVNVLVPVFVELVEKYSKNGISMQMDASNLLEGGREIRFEFGLGETRTQLLGTATTEGIAFHETRYTPDSHGELASGPMLRLRHLNEKVFREFICERLAQMVRNATRRR